MAVTPRCRLSLRRGVCFCAAQDGKQEVNKNRFDGVVQLEEDMRVGVPKEIKNHEYRVGLTPASVHELVAHGHEVLVQAGAGAEIGLHDDQYRTAGASIVTDAAEIFMRAEMIVKVKEPQAAECAMLRPDQILYTYLHLAPDPEQTAALVQSGAVCIAYETITGPGAACRC
jgi:alanine dehydrogenase